MDIAEAFDAVGGEANAATGKEHTCYYARVLDADLPMAVDVIADMVTSARLDADELETERGVILEELAMNDDDPTDVAHEQFAAGSSWATHPLGRPIGGTPETIRRRAARRRLGPLPQHYRPETLVVTAAGGVDHDQLCALVPQALAAAGWRPRRGRSLGATAATPRADRATAPSRAVLTVRRSTEQANSHRRSRSAGHRPPALRDVGAERGARRRHVSRLFQEIREKRGLAYSVYSFASGYADSGYFGLYAGCAPAKVAPGHRAARPRAGSGSPPRRSPQTSWSAHWGSSAADWCSGMEDTGSRMWRLGKAELVYGEFCRSTSRSSASMRSRPTDVRRLAADLSARPRSLAVVGPFDHDPVKSI